MECGDPFGIEKKGVRLAVLSKATSRGSQAIEGIYGKACFDSYSPARV